MTMTHSEIMETARLWAIRLHDSSFDDWDGFTGWLEADAQHLAAYEAALTADSWAADLFRHAPAAPLSLWQPPAHRQPRRRWYAMGGAVAAALVAVTTFTMLDRNAPSEIITAPGEHRTIPLADGSRIILNGDTRITLDPDTPREVELAAGEALFEVKHDDRNPFVVVVGKTRLIDAGTVFNVVSEKGALDVAVSEGAVIYEPGREEIRLGAGDALSRASAQAVPVLRKAIPETVGGWQTGRLQYADAPLDQVARDLSRNLGTKVYPANGADRLRFTGTLVVSGAPDEVLKRAGSLLGVNFAANGDAWRMTPSNGAPPY